MTAPRPKCGWCGASYGHRRTKEVAIVWREGEKPPPYHGNVRVLRTREHGPLRLIEDVLGRSIQKDDRYHFLETWDGESWWGGYAPFCTLRCALDYAQRTFKRYGKKRGL